MFCGRSTIRRHKPKYRLKYSVLLASVQWECRRGKCLTVVHFFTVHNEVAKVMFLHMSVILFTGGGCYPSMPCSRSPGGCLLRGDAPGGGGGGGDPPQADAYCCGRYASYWNAFLLLKRNITGLGNRVRLSSGRNDHTIQCETRSVTVR